MLLLGLILLIIGFVAKVHILWIAGLVLLVVGAILVIVGRSGRYGAVGRRGWY